VRTQASKQPTWNVGDTTVRSGSPAYSASAAVECAVYTWVSRNRSTSAYLVRETATARALPTYKYRRGASSRFAGKRRRREPHGTRRSSQAPAHGSTAHPGASLGSNAHPALTSARRARTHTGPHGTQHPHSTARHGTTRHDTAPSRHRGTHRCMLTVRLTLGRKRTLVRGTPHDSASACSRSSAVFTRRWRQQQPPPPSSHSRGYHSASATATQRSDP
jgi:hypothetical protein